MQKVVVSSLNSRAVSPSLRKDSTAYCQLGSYDPRLLDEATQADLFIFFNRIWIAMVTLLKNYWESTSFLGQTYLVTFVHL